MPQLPPDTKKTTPAPEASTGPATVGQRGADASSCQPVTQHHSPVETRSNTRTCPTGRAGPSSRKRRNTELPQLGLDSPSTYIRRMTELGRLTLPKPRC